MSDKLPETLSLLAPISVIAAAAAAEGETPGRPRFDMVAYTGDVIRLDGWYSPVIVDLAGVQIPDRSLPVRFGHSAEIQDGIGHTDAVSINDGKILASGVVSRDTPAAKEVVGSAAQGFPWQASIGASAIRVEQLKQGETATVNGRTVTGPLNIVRAARLDEISVVDIGADRNTNVKVAAGASQGGHDVAEDRNTGGAGGDSSAEILARAKAERERLTAIRALAEEYSQTRGADLAGIEGMLLKAEAEGWTVKDTELALLRASRPQVASFRRGDEPPTQQVLEAALCMSVGIKDEVLVKDRSYGAQVVEKAWPLRARGLRGVLAMALEAQGHRVPHGGADFFTTILEKQHVRAGGFSTINLPGLIGNVANKMLLQMFLEVAVTYDTIAEQADFSNFHQHTIFRLDHLGDFQKVGPAGDLKHGSLGETKFTNQLDTYGQTLGLSRQAIINDDLNAFTSLTRSLARKSRIAVEKALYLQIMESSNVFYTSGQGNLVASNGLSVAGLAAAEGALMGMTDANGDPIYAMGKIVLVPPALKAVADSLYVSEILLETTTTDKAQGNGNPFRGRYPAATSPFLAASIMHGYSSTTWYLLADPVILPAFQVAYLDGRRAPVVETADAEFSTLGLAMRGYFDFGVAQIDYRGAIKNTA